MAAKELHSVRLDFSDGVLTGRLIHPESGCQPATNCPECEADTSDPNSERCPMCEGEVPLEGECWIEGWFDQYTINEVLDGEVDLPVIPECDGESFTLKIAATSLSKAEAPDAS
ncbi:MAG TPA: hypothetical protein VLC07_00945 [Solirubrobacterales bacterium]|nr:hypothetical protein [Solirubrobacterales bacterium]